MYLPLFNLNCPIRRFEAFKTPFVVQSIILNIRRDKVYGFVFILVSMSSLRSVFAFFFTGKKNKPNPITYYRSTLHPLPRLLIERRAFLWDQFDQFPVMNGFRR